MRSGLATLSFLAAIWALTFLPRMAEREVTSIVEARVGITAREMWRAGEWVLPTMNGELRLQKPPLSYWAAQSLAWARGTFDDVSLRLPFALFALGAALFTYAMGRRLGGSQRGLAAAVIIITSALYVKGGRTASADVALLFCVAGSLHFYLLARLEDRALWPALLWTFLGLGNLAKGPVVLAVVLIPVLVEAMLVRSLKPLRPLWSPAGIAAFLLLSLVWPGLVILRLSGQMSATEAIHRWYLESFGKILPSDGIDEGYKFQRHAGPFYFYLVRFPAVIGFWTILLAPWAVTSMRERSWRRFGRGIWEGDLNCLPALWSLITLIFFSLISEKKTAYLLPMLPATSLWLAKVVDEGFERWREWLKRGVSWLAIASGILIAFTLAATLLGIPAWVISALPRDFGDIVPRIYGQAGWTTLGLCVLGAACALLLKSSLRQPGTMRATVIVGVTLGLGGLIYDEIRERVEPQNLSRQAGRETQQATVGALQAAALGNLPAGMLYYADRVVKTFEYKRIADLASLPVNERVLVRDRVLEHLVIQTPRDIGQRLGPPLERFEVLGTIDAGTSAEKDSILVLAAR